MGGKGRPLRFLALVVLGWTGLRTALLWSPAVEDPLMPALGVFPTASAARRAAFVPRTEPATWAPPLVGRSVERRSHPRNLTDAEMLAMFGMSYFPNPTAPHGLAAASALSPPPGAAAVSAGGAAATAPVALSRWSLDTWFVARGGRGDPALSPQLGGTQAGARLAFAFGRDRRAAVYLRASSAFVRDGGEVAAGAQLRPTAAPVVAFAEVRRRAHGDLAPAVGVSGGVYREPLPGNFRLDGYGQAGAIGGRYPSRFVDGQLRVSRPVAAADGLVLDAGAGAWGAAQRGANRFDVGPSIGVDLPVARRTLRLTLDWRQRVAGNAAPASGAVLTLGAGF